MTRNLGDTHTTRLYQSSILLRQAALTIDIIKGGTRI